MPVFTNTIVCKFLKSSKLLKILSQAKLAYLAKNCSISAFQNTPPFFSLKKHPFTKFFSLRFNIKELIEAQKMDLKRKLTESPLETVRAISSNGIDSKENAKSTITEVCAESTQNMGDDNKSHPRLKKRKVKQITIKSLLKIADRSLMTDINMFFADCLSHDRLENDVDREKVANYFSSSELTKDESYFLSPPYPAVKNFLITKEQFDTTQNRKSSGEKIESDLTDSPEAEKQQEVIRLFVHQLLTNGTGLATLESHKSTIELLKAGKRIWVFVVPFTLEGEVVDAKVIENHLGYSVCDLVSVVEPSQERITPKCRYFAKCSGCHLQMASYGKQLEFKRRCVLSAMRAESSGIFNANFPVNDIISSPCEFEYRTKITPHFDVFGWLPFDKTPIGFNYVNRREILDIEECVIATKPVNDGLTSTRKITKSNFKDFKRGATLLIRETIVPDPSSNLFPDPLEAKKGFALSHKDTVEEYVSVFESLSDNPSNLLPLLNNLSDNSKTLQAGSSIPKIISYSFQYQANSFFQNNNSILPKLVHYVRSELFMANQSRLDLGHSSISNLVDAYCGAGLFAIGCNLDFEKVVGIEISKESIKNAISNSERNGISNCSFLQGDAANIFAKIDPKVPSCEYELTSSQTAVIIDPPRKGSNPDFLKQLVEYGPAAIVYVACGVPAQFRDLDFLIKLGSIQLEDSNLDQQSENEKKALYKIMSIQPFDLFPQTYHVENVVTLVRIN